MISGGANMKIGFIGLGKMGSGLAKNLVRNNKSVILYDLNEQAVQEVIKEGGTGIKAQSLKDLYDVEVLFTSLPMPKDLEQLYLADDQGLFHHLKPGTLCVELSTIDPKTARTLFDAAKAYNIDYLQCTLGLTPKQANEGTEPMYVGGEKEVFERIQPVLKLIAGDIAYLGEVETSAAFKLLSNLIGMTNLVVLSEGIRIAEKAGLNQEQMLNLLLETGALSFQMKVRGPWIIHGDFDNRFGLSLALKDVRLGIEMAKVWHSQVDTMMTALNYYEKAYEEGYGMEDCNAVYKVVK